MIDLVEKCVCGYAYREDAVTYDDGDEVSLPDIGDEAFVLINITATQAEDVHDPCNNLAHVTIVMCPKCKTLKVFEVE